MVTTSTDTQTVFTAQRRRVETKRSNVVLAVGCTGYFGSHILRALAERHKSAEMELVITRLPGEPTEPIKAFLGGERIRHRFLEMDLTKIDDTLADEMREATHIIKASGVYAAGQGPESEALMQKVNADASRAFYEILQKERSRHGIDPKVVEISSVAAMGDTEGRVLSGGQSVVGARRGGSVYERTKRIGQYWAEVAAANGARVDIVQPGMLNGAPGIEGMEADGSPITRMVRDASLGGVPIRARTNFGVCPTSAQAAAEVTVVVLFQEGSGRILGASSNNTRMSFLLDCARALRGLPPLRRMGAIPDGALYLAGHAQRYLPRSINRHVEDFLDFRGLPPELLGAFDATRGTYWRTSNTKEITGIELPQGVMPLLLTMAGDLHYGGIDTVPPDTALVTLMQGGYDLTLGPDGFKDRAVETLQLVHGLNSAV